MLQERFRSSAWLLLENVEYLKKSRRRIWVMICADSVWWINLQKERRVEKSCCERYARLIIIIRWLIDDVKFMSIFARRWPISKLADDRKAKKWFKRGKKIFILFSRAFTQMHSQSNFQGFSLKLKKNYFPSIALTHTISRPQNQRNLHQS